METTKNYGIFKFMEGNRDIDQKNLKKIKESIKRNGWLGGVIIVNESYEIVDGQHRFLALKELEMPIQYEMKKGYGIRQVEILNTAQKPWKIKDIIDSECKLGNQSYIWLKEMMTEYPFLNASVIASIATDKNFNSRVTAQIKGRYFGMTYDEYIRTKEYLKCIGQVKPIVSEYATGSVNFYKAMVWCLKDDRVDNAVLVDKIRKHMKTIVTRIGKLDDCFRDLEKIYNYRNHVAVYVPIHQMRQEEARLNKKIARKKYYEEHEK